MFYGTFYYVIWDKLLFFSKTPAGGTHLNGQHLLRVVFRVCRLPVVRVCVCAYTHAHAHAHMHRASRNWSDAYYTQTQIERERERARARERERERERESERASESQPLHAAGGEKSPPARGRTDVKPVARAAL